MPQLRISPLAAVVALASALVFAAPTGSAHASPAVPTQAGKAPADWTLQEREQWTLMEKEIAQYVTILNDKCEGKVAVSFDKETFRGSFMEAGKTGLAASRWWQSATESVSTLRNLCIATPTAKAAVKTKVTKVVIQHAGGGRAHQFAGGTITAVVDTAAAPREWQTTYQDFVKSKL